MSANAIDLTLQLLNDEPDKRYCLTYLPDLKAWRVIQLELAANHVFKDQQLWRLLPGGTNHNNASDALKDALILKNVAHAST